MTSSLLLLMSFDGCIDGGCVDLFGRPPVRQGLRVVRTMANTGGGITDTGRRAHHDRECHAVAVMTDMMRCSETSCKSRHPFSSQAIAWGWVWGITETPRGSRMIEACPRHAASIDTIARLEAVGTDHVQVKHITDSLIIRAIYMVATDDERIKAFWQDMRTLLWWVPWRVLDRKLEQLERRGVIDRHGSVTVIRNMEAVR